MARGITYDQVRNHRLKREVEKINDILSDHFSSSDEPIDIKISDVNRNTIVEEFKKGWEIEWSRNDYDTDAIYFTFSPKPGSDYESDNY